MALPDDAAHQLAARTAAMVDLLSKAAFARFWEAVKAGTPVESAIEAAQVGFSGEFADKLAAAFSELLRRSVGTAEVRAMPVGDFPLSTRLHRHNVQTQNEVVAIVRQHAQGIHQARELSLRLYDGYTPADGVKRPLEGAARAELPKYLRWLTEDNTARRELTAIQVAGQEQVARLKSQALRAGYNEAIEMWVSGAGQDAVARRLEIAQREKNRFFANRIAQTELARAHQAEVAAEFMADETIDAVKVVLNPRHPFPDICDMHARADLFGLGPGVYPKAKAPRPPFHPHCWCVIRSKPSLFGMVPREAPGGEALFLRSLPPEEAARVMGSRARAKAVLDGDSVQAVVNAGKDPAYRLVRLGDAEAGRHALVRAVELPTMTINQTGSRIVAGLVETARLAPENLEGRLEALWVNPQRYATHVAKRISAGHVDSAADYARKTFAVLSSADRLLITESANPAMRSTGKVQVAADGWVVLLSGQGHIVTSYPFDPESISFEARHTLLGDSIHEHRITQDHRAALAKLFGAG